MTTALFSLLSFLLIK
ncbi:hypothetical protein YPPY59_0885, partial [Yersinia pestis PY-59]